MRLICGHCGHVNPSGASFCEQCDEYLDWTAVEARDEPPMATPGPMPPAQAAPPRQDAPDVSPAPTAVLTEPARACPRCATGNPLDRRFCRRCGQWLVPASAVPAAPARPWRSWWQRLVGPLNRADRAAYRRSLSPVTRAFRVALMVLLVVVLVVVLSPFTGNPVRRARDLVGHQLGSGRTTLPSIAAAILPELGGRTANQARAAHVERLVDGVRSSTWTTARPAGTPRSDAALAGVSCGSGSLIGFVLRFPQPLDVREIGFESGGVGDLGPADKIASWLPQTVDLQWTVREGDQPPRTECRRFELEPTGALQRLPGPDAPASNVRVTVLRAFAPPQPRGAADLRVGEVTIWQR